VKFPLPVQIPWPVTFVSLAISWIIQGIDALQFPRNLRSLIVNDIDGNILVWSVMKVSISGTRNVIPSQKPLRTATLTLMPKHVLCARMGSSTMLAPKNVRL
jgi:hypothetical protein